MTTTAAQKIDRSALLRRAWQIAREADTAARAAVRTFLGDAIRQAWVEARMVPQMSQQQQANGAAVEPVAAEPIRIEFGRGVVIRDAEGIVFRGQVTGGGANGPGTVNEVTGFATTERPRWSQDNRSGSGRSGWVEWRLEADRLYGLARVAYNSQRTSDYYVSTFDDGVVELSLAEYRAELRRLYPLGAQEADELQARRAAAEAARIVAERAEVERRKAEAEALKAANASEAERLERGGQPAVEGLPALTGSMKQISYALKIRAAVQVHQPKLTALKTATTAKYWIENHRAALYR